MEETQARSLMLRMHRGDESAAETLWALFAPRLTAYARVLLPSGTAWAAEDVVQGVFVKVIGMRRSTLRQVRDGTAVLFRITRNEALNLGRGELRERARRTARAEQAARVEIDGEVTATLEAIDRLCFEQREVILLRYLGGLTIEQASVALGVNRNTVASRSRLGLARVRELMGVEMREVRDG